MESLSRNGTSADDDDAENESAADGAQNARVGSRNSSNRHNIADTIERNVDSLNNTSGDNTQTTDPLFHKMSKAFDEGGAKGMLMNNMVSHLCTVQYQEAISQLYCILIL